MFNTTTPYKKSAQDRLGTIGRKIRSAMAGIVSAMTGLDALLYPKEKTKNASPLANLTETDEQNVGAEIGQEVRKEYEDFCRAAKEFQLAVEKAEKPYLAEDEQSEAKANRQAISKAITDGISSLVNAGREGVEAFKQGVGE